MLTRRLFLAGSGAAFAVPSFVHAAAGDGVPTSLDHIILGVSDLGRGIAWVERRSGVRASNGGAPEPKSLAGLNDTLGIGLQVRRQPHAGLHATLRGIKGEFTVAG